MTEDLRLGLYICHCGLNIAGVISPETLVSQAQQLPEVAVCRHHLTPAVKCEGVNACKGTSACATATNACQGQNGCKGHGNLMLTKAECDAAKAKMKEEKKS